MTADAPTEWVCQCRRCLGVRNTMDAVQYAYELWLDDPQTPMIIGFAALFQTGRSSLTVPFLAGEPDALGLPGLRVWVFSFRPGSTAVPTEGDIARWDRWDRTEGNFVDWIIIDGDLWTSVANVGVALRERRPVPGPRRYSKYWWREPDAASSGGGR